MLFSHPVMSNSLQPRGRQHSRPPCPSPFPRVCPSSPSLYWWCHPASSCSDALFSFYPQPFPASGTFPLSQLFISDDQNTGVSVSASVLLVTIQGWSPLRLTGFISLQSKGLSGVFSSTTVRRHQLFGVLLSLWCNSHNHTPGKTIPLTIQTFVSGVISLLFNTLSCHRFPAKKQLSSDFLAAVTIISDFVA